MGGSSNDFGFGIAVDSSGSAYVTGSTGSTDFPTLNPYQTDHGGYYYDAFVTKLSSSGHSLVYSTDLGGSNYDWGFGIAVDGSGSAHVTGQTRSTDFPTLNPYQTNNGGGYNDVFVTKLSSSGNSLVYSTYLGGSGSDVGYSIAADGSGSAYVTGHTRSTDFPTLNPYQTGQGYFEDVFVTKLSEGSSIPAPTITSTSPNPSFMGNVTVTWSEVSEGSGYELELANNPGFLPIEDAQIIASNTITEFAYSCLEEGTWYVRVRTDGGGGEYSSWSTTDDFEVDFTSQSEFSITDDVWNFSNSSSNVWDNDYYDDALEVEYWTNPSYNDWFAVDFCGRKGITSEMFPSWPLYDYYWKIGNNVDFYADANAGGSLVYQWWDFLQTEGPYWGGSCAGFCISSLLMYEEDPHSPIDVYGETRLRDVSAGPAMNPTAAFHDINAYHLTQYDNDKSTYRSAHYYDSPDQTLQSLVTSLRQSPGNGKSRYLSIRDRYGSGFAHAVVPLSVEYQGCGTNTAHINVYDPNFGYTEQPRTITINLNTNEWSYDARIGDDDIMIGGAIGLYVNMEVKDFDDYPGFGFVLDLSDFRLEPEAIADRRLLVKGTDNYTILMASGDSAGVIGDSVFFPDTSVGLIPILPVSPNAPTAIGFYIPEGEFTVSIRELSSDSGFVSLASDGIHRSLQFSTLSPSTCQLDITMTGLIEELNIQQVAGDESYVSAEIVTDLAGHSSVTELTSLPFSTGASAVFSQPSDSVLDIQVDGQTGSYSLYMLNVYPDSAIGVEAQDIQFDDGIAQQIIVQGLEQGTPDSFLVLNDPTGDGSFDDTTQVDNDYVEACCRVIRGNVDGDSGDGIDISDLVFLIDYMFRDGPEPVCTAEADVDGDVEPLNISDLVYLVDYMFVGGPAPVACP